jgi:extradiol dioxygenase family protein
MEPIRFHLAFPVADIALAKAYYGDGLGCEIGRETSAAVILTCTAINWWPTSPTKS